MSQNINFSLINLWCNKNLVDSQHLLWKLLSQNNEETEINYFSDPFSENIDIVFINTCWFIRSWREEMLDTIQEVLKNWKKIGLFWCWLEYFERLDKKSYPEILDNPNIRKINWKNIDKITPQKILKSKNYQEFDWFEFPKCERAYTNIQYWFEYIKISEGCDNNCSFCIIPKIRGKQKSKKIKTILEETENIIESWGEEIIFLAQDTTRYWTDIYWKPSLFELLEKTEKLEKDFYYRLLYLYPDIVSLKQLKKLSKMEKFLPYFDIPIQHISSNVLKRMKRFYDENYIYKFWDFIENNFPERFIRTNIIVWFPWETQKDFEKLYNFLKKTDIDNISIFEYHDEEKSESKKLNEKIDYKTIHQRFLILKELTDKKLQKKYEKRKHKEQYWYITNISENKITVRPYMSAPEIDPYDKIEFEKIKRVLNENGIIDIWEKIIYNI